MAIDHPFPYSGDINQVPLVKTTFKRYSFEMGLISLIHMRIKEGFQLEEAHLKSKNCLGMFLC